MPDGWIAEWRAWCKEFMTPVLLAFCVVVGAGDVVGVEPPAAAGILCDWVLGWKRSI